MNGVYIQTAKWPVSFPNQKKKLEKKKAVHETEPENKPERLKKKK